jgi:hypothetical protein
MANLRWVSRVAYQSATPLVGAGDIYAIVGSDEIRDAVDCINLQINRARPGFPTLGSRVGVRMKLSYHHAAGHERPLLTIDRGLTATWSAAHRDFARGDIGVNPATFFMSPNGVSRQ